MSVAERVLMFFSRDPDAEDLNLAVNDWNEENAFQLLDRFIPEFRRLIAGNRFVDFGCGAGEQSIALLRNGAASVLGVDINAEALASLEAKARQLGLQDRLETSPEIAADHEGRFDYVISQNSMEHFPEPERILERMRAALTPQGRIVMTFGPPWFAPYGSHMHFFTRLPWVNVLFSERTVLNVRKRYRDDGAERYEDVAYGLNKMSLRKFERLVADSGLGFHYRNYTGVKKMDVLTRVPMIREFFTNQVSCILEKKT